MDKSIMIFTLPESILFLYSIIAQIVDSRIYLSVNNTIVVEGGSTIFECGYSGSGMITWRVNNIEFTPPRRPEKHSLSISDDRLLILSDADLSMNGSRYQCTAESLISSTVHLFVLPAANIYLYFEDNNIMQINVSSTYYSDTFPMITAFEHESSENYKNTKRLFSSFSTVSTLLNNCRNGSDHGINPSTPVVIIVIGILAPIICFAFGCGTCGILILVTRYNHLKEVTEIQTNRNEAYQTVNQHPEAMAQNPIYEHVA